MAARRTGWVAAPRKRAAPPRPGPAGTWEAPRGQGSDGGHEDPPTANVCSSALGHTKALGSATLWGSKLIEKEELVSESSLDERIKPRAGPSLVLLR